jgi:hypothetical protein
VIRTVVAVTDPLVAAGPNALTQLPTARSVDAAVWVALTVVELDVVILRVSVFVLGAVGFLFFEEDFAVPRPNDPGLMLIPDTVMVEPLTPVTLPEPMARLARALRKLEDPPPPKLGRVPPSAPPPPAPPPRRKPPPPANPPAPPAAAPVPVRPPSVHDPEELAVLTVMVRAAMVVFDFFDGVPLTVTQSPLASALTASVTVLENVVVVLQFTVVCPELAFWTSMLDPLSEATLPEAPMGALAGVVAAPAAEATAVAASNAVAPVPAKRMKRRRLLLRLVSDCIVLILFLFLVVVNRVLGWMGLCA